MSRLDPRRVLLRLPNWIGDGAMATAAVRAFLTQRPDVELEVIGRGGTPDLIHGLLPESSCHRLTAGALRGLRGRFDLGVLLPDSFSSAWYFVRLALPSLGRRGDARTLLLRHARPPRRRPSTVHMVDEWDELLEPLGVRPSQAESRLEFSASERESGRLALRAVSGGPDPVVLCPGAAFGNAKRWPAESYSALARELSARGITCVSSGGPGEEELAAAVARACGTRPLLGMPVREWAAALSGARLVVANDSGAAHVAAAAGVPVVAIFGSTDPVWSRPRGSGHRVISLGLGCSPCYARECPLGHLDCLRHITVASVAESALAMLSP